MRKMLIIEVMLAAVLGLAILAVVLAPPTPRMLLYPLVREAAQAKLGFETRQMAVHETPHFVIKYSPPDADAVAMVAEAAEAAYGPVTAALGHSPDGKAIVVIYPDRRELNKTFGWSGDQSAMGVYWGGVIQVLSPRVWFQGTADEFSRSGPMVHEFTHLVFDHLSRGNYPRWFTEGLAQYLEYKINGFEWRTADNGLGGHLYSMTELEQSFDTIPNQALAYRQSLAAVRYIADVHGEDKLRQINAALAAGRGLEEAINASLSIDYAAFAAEWPQWAKQNMQ